MDRTAEFDVRQVYHPRNLGLAAIRIAVAAALLGLGMALLGLLADAQRGPQRKLQVSEGAWGPALVIGLASSVPAACLAGFMECVLPLLAFARIRSGTLLLAASLGFAAVGAWTAWAILSLDSEAIVPKRLAIDGSAGILFLLVGALQAALWLAAYRPHDGDLDSLPFAWHLALAVLAALTLGGRWGWTAIDGKVRIAADRRQERWRAADAPPLKAAEAPAEPWTR